MFAEHRPLARHLRRLSGQARTLPCSRGTATLILQLRKLKLSKAELWEFPGGPVVGGFVGSSVSKESACSAGDPGSSPGWGRSPGGGSGNPLQYLCLENLMDRRAWWAAVNGVTEFGMTGQLTLTYLLPLPRIALFNRTCYKNRNAL